MLNVAIEVVSPTNAWEEIMDKSHDYFASGVERVWVVSPSAEQVYVYTAVDANQIYNRADMLEDDAIAGLRCRSSRYSRKSQRIRPPS